MTTDCKTCPVSTGTHKPAPAAPAPDERAAFVAWLRVKPCGAAHDFGWAAWQARAALAATQPAAQGVDVVQAAKALCKHAAKVQNINFDDYWLIHAEEFKEEAQIVLDAAQAKQGEKP